MYVKLSLRNMQRSVKEYAIYLFTLVLSVGLFYGFSTISSEHYQASIPVQYNVQYLQQIIKYPVTVVAFLIIFLILFVNKHLLQSRQREFALQTLMGMEQKNMASVFFVESLFMGIVAIVCGIILGMLMSQIVTALIMNVYGVPFKMFFSLYTDTAFQTIVLFLAIFTVVGIGNIRTIRKMKIIDMLNSDRKTNEDYSTSKNIFIWVIISCICAVCMTGMGVYAVTQGHIQQFTSNGYYWGDSAVFWLYSGAILPLVFLITAALFLVSYVKKKKNASILVLIMSFLGLLCGLCAISLYIRLMISSLYPFVAVVFILFAIFGFFDCISGVIIYIKDKSLNIRYKNIFLFGQITDKLKINSKAMATISLALTGAMVILSITSPMSKITAEYRKNRTMFDVVVTMNWYSSESIAQLPTAEFSYQFVEDYLVDNGYTMAEKVAVKYYFLDESDYDNKYDYSNWAPLFISLTEYNQLRRMAGYSEASLNNDEFVMYWDNLANKEDVDNFEEEHSGIFLGDSMYYFKESNHEYLGEFVSSGNYTLPVYVIPDEACKGQFVAAVRYYGNTTKPLAYDFANIFARDITKKIQSEHLIFEQLSNYRQPYVFLKTTLVAEGTNLSILLSLTLIYIAVILLIICFTVLSVQLLSDSSKYKQRFQILDRLGMAKKEQQRLILKQMIYWFGIPVVVAVLAAIGCIVFYINADLAQVLAYVGISAFIMQIALACFVISLLLGCYFILTFLLFKRVVD